MMTDVGEVDTLAAAGGQEVSTWSPPSARPGRPRSEQAERAIIEATLDLLVEVGIAALSIEQVAARAGVGKATIYRRWPNKEALIIDAAASLKSPLPEVPGRSIREDLKIIADVMVADQQTARARELYTCFVSEGRRHPDLAKKFTETVIEPRRDYMRSVLRGAVARGELRDDLDVDTMVIATTGSLMYASMVWPQFHLAEGNPKGLTDRLVDTILDGLRPR
jgi:AcrR family transcriptional regulator